MSKITVAWETGLAVSRKQEEKTRALIFLRSYLSLMKEFEGISWRQVFLE